MKERNDFIERYNELISYKENAQQIKIDINSKEREFFALRDLFHQANKTKTTKKFLVPFFFKFFLFSRKIFMSDFQIHFDRNYAEKYQA